VGQIQNQPVNLDGLLGHLGVSAGLYSRETFMALFSCMVRIIRQYHLKGLIFHRLLADSDFETLGLALDGLSGVSSFAITDDDVARCGTLDPEHTGLVVVLTNQFCATLYWKRATEDTYRMWDGGWTFHPGDSKTMALQLAQFMPDSETLAAKIEETPLDRRYDEKVTGFITHLVNNLENRNRELTMALDEVGNLNAKIVDQERLAAIGQLCSVIAHEIRNPLGLIDLYAKLIENQVAGLEVAEGANKVALEKNLALIRSATGNLETILSELTQYARPLELNLERTDLRTVVMEVVDMFMPRYEEKGVELTWKFPPEPVDAEYDSPRIKQALINLVKNALEASKPETTVHVALAVRQGDDQLFIKVSDQGSGVDERSKAKLFTPYFSTKGNGTGLGLAHSRKILQAHGGTVALLESSGQGSTFALVLPRPGAKKPKPGTSHRIEELPIC